MAVNITKDDAENPVIKFSGKDLIMYAQAGLLRQLENISNNVQDAYGFKGDGWGVHIEGALGEAAVACYLNMFWSVGSMRSSDVGKYQVRTTSNVNNKLFLHPRDSDDDIFISVFGKAPTYMIRGWIKGADGKRDSWWADPTRAGRPAFFVPTGKLKHINKLLAESEDGK